MQKILCCLFALCLMMSAYADSEKKSCLKWKKVCYQKTDCLYRDAQRHACFFCKKPNHYGFHLYPDQIERNTCNLNTVHYLQTMGYRCYQPHGAQICVKKRVRTDCHLQCTINTKPTETRMERMRSRAQ